METVKPKCSICDDVAILEKPEGLNKTWYCYIHFPRNAEGKVGTHICRAYNPFAVEGQPEFIDGVTVTDQEEQEYSFKTFMEHIHYKTTEDVLFTPVKSYDHLFKQTRSKHDHKTRNVMKKFKR